MCSLFLMLCGAMFAATVQAPGAEIEGLTVVEVDFSPPRQPLTREHLGEVVMVKEGAPLNLRQVRETLHNLFATGRYSKQIAVDYAKQNGGVKITFLAEPSWFIGLVRIVGAVAPPTESQLLNVTELELGEIYTEEKVQFAKQEIRRLLEENGFFAPKITHTASDNPEFQQRDIEITLVPGLRAGIGNIILARESPDEPPVLTPEEARRITRWRRGKPFHQRRIQRGLIRLEEHFHKDDRWRAEPRVTGGEPDADSNLVSIVLQLNRGPRVRVRVEGEQFSSSQLRKYLPIYEEGVVDDDLLEEGRRNLRDHLQSRGYFDAKVDYFRATERADEVVIVYNVERGRRHRLVRLTVRGNRFFDLDTIRERMLIREKSFQFRRGRYNESMLERDRRAIQDLYRSNGFREVKVEGAVEDDLGGREGHLAVSLTIDEGEPTIVSEVRIHGAEQIPAEEFYPELTSAPQQVFSELSIATDRDLILGTYFNNGFQDARFSWKQIAAAEPNRVIVEYTIQEGESLRIRRPIITGLTHTQESLVSGQVRVTPGGPLSQSAMFETQRRLYDLGIFSKVDVDLQNPEGSEPSKNVLLQVQEARRWTVGVGGGAEFARIGSNTADVTSPVGDASFSPRVTLELTRLNLRGRGHTASMRTRFSNLQQRALFTYEAPRFTGSDKWRMIVSGLLDTSRNVRTFTGRRLEGAFQLQHKISKPSTALYRYTYRRTSIDEGTLQITPDLIPLAAQPVRVALLSGTYIQDRRDDPTNATKGTYNTVDLSFASNIWASQADFFRFLGQNSTYYRLGRGLVLARTIQLGLMTPRGGFPQVPSDAVESIPFASNPDTRIPLSERFFGGGANSHRGFPVNQAGPRDPTTGFPIGGGALFLNSVELRFPLIGENIGGVLFHDAGNVYSRLGRVSFKGRQEAIVENATTAGYEFDYMVHAVGFGLRYRTPVGPVRLDLAYSVNPPRFIGFRGTREELLAGGGMISNQRISGLQFHFSLGQRF